MQLALFGPCRLVRDIRRFVRDGGPQPVKACACKSPCWWRNGAAGRAA